MELKGKEKQPIRQKDSDRLDFLILQHPAELTLDEELEKQKLMERRNLYGVKV